MSRKLFVIGTGTDVGKTFVTGLIVKKLNDSHVKAAYYKAAMSGNERDDKGNLIPGDALYVKNISGIEQPLETMCPYIYENAVSPHLASRMEGNPVDLEVVKEGLCALEDDYDYITLEGSGGILCPICYDEREIWLEDVIKAADSDCLMIADAGLGTINYVGLTSFYLKEHGIALKGIIFNNYEEGNVMHEDNIKMCEKLTGVKVIATVKHGDGNLDISTDLLKELYR